MLIKSCSMHIKVGRKVGVTMKSYQFGAEVIYQKRDPSGPNRLRGPWGHHLVSILHALSIFCSTAGTC